MKNRELWYDDKANKQKVEDLEDTEAHEVLYNLTEDILCLKEDISGLELKLKSARGEILTKEEFHGELFK